MNKEKLNKFAIIAPYWSDCFENTYKNNHISVTSEYKDNIVDVLNVNSYILLIAYLFIDSSFEWMNEWNKWMKKGK